MVPETSPALQSRRYFPFFSRSATLEKLATDLLIGDYADHRECHISPDWLLIYQTTGTELILVRTGSHSTLFG